MQLLKLPLLFGHFQAHLAEGRSDDFMDFLKEHYTRYHHNDEDSRQDNELPFKATSAESFAGLYITSVAAPTVAAMHVEMTEHSPRRYDFTVQDCNTGVFHPPKAA